MDAESLLYRRPASQIGLRQLPHFPLGDLPCGIDDNRKRQPAGHIAQLAGPLRSQHSVHGDWKMQGHFLQKFLHIFRFVRSQA